jgi:hypothetical protein
MTEISARALAGGIRQEKSSGQSHILLHLPTDIHSLFVDKPSSNCGMFSPAENHRYTTLS